MWILVYHTILNLVLPSRGHTASAMVMTNEVMIHEVKIHEIDMGTDPDIGHTP